MSGGLAVALLPGRLAVCRLGPREAVPEWFDDAAPLSGVTRTADELSLVCAEDAVPDGVQAERGWRVLELQGPFAFTLTGVLAAILVPLADAGVPIFALSTFDTDYVLVPGGRVEDAVAALRGAGHDVAS